MYCLNIHPGETLDDVCHALNTDVRAVKAVVSPDAPYAVGLRLSGVAAETLSTAEAMDRLRETLATNDMTVAHINGFPFGAFHATRVKEHVYEPDWTTQARLIYTGRLAQTLATLMPADACGSISTVPVAYARTLAMDDTTRRLVAVRQVVTMALFLDELRTTTGRTIQLALEPEPGCILETVDDVIRWYEDELLTEGVAWLAGSKRMTRDAAELLIRTFVGICVDTCHAAVLFEDPQTVLIRLASAGIPVARVQVSAALTMRVTPEAIQRVAAFEDGVWLHQMAIRTATGRVKQYDDITAETLVAIAEDATGCAWRAHVHVPLSYAGDAVLGTTRDVLTTAFFEQARGCPLEIETYTTSVLPRDVVATDVVASIIAEERWLAAALR